MTGGEPLTNTTRGVIMTEVEMSPICVDIPLRDIIQPQIQWVDLIQTILRYVNVLWRLYNTHGEIMDLNTCRKCVTNLEVITYESPL